jgi:hypothetical protein
MRIDVPVEFRREESGEPSKFVIHASNLMLHTDKMRESNKISSKFFQQRETRKYFNQKLVLRPVKEEEISEDKKFENWKSNCMFCLNQFEEDPEFSKLLEYCHYKNLSIEVIVPYDGIPIYPGPDTLEFLKSRKGKRLLHKLAKNKKGDTI